ncbi:MAG: pentapeptide repeat-containing protein, partial [Methylococcaceae bacterium]|nr:pentapeptide repeat-containing protein [Methylococcaceae bacterium]
MILYIKEIPDRRKEFHYEAWTIIDGTKNTKTSYARFMALTDLNDDGIPLKGVDLCGTELAGIRLPGAKMNSAKLIDSDLSEADLNEVDLSEA